LFGLFLSSSSSSFFLRNLHGGLAEKISGGGNGDVADDFYHRYKVRRMLVIGFQRGKKYFFNFF